MPATALTVTQLSHATARNITLADTPGVDADATNGNSVANGGSTLLVCNNTAGSSATVTIDVAQTVDGQAVTDRVFTVPANKVHLIKLGPPTVYGNPTIVTASATTVKLAAYSL